MTLTSRDQLIALNAVPGLRPSVARQLVEALGSVEAIGNATVLQLRQAGGMREQLARQVLEACRNERWVQQELVLAKEHGADLITWDDEAYPASLRTIHDPPPVLYVRGTLPSAQEPAVAIVGTRLASAYGLQSAERLAYDLALRGITVVSGMARGIDGAAHQGALKAGGRTLAVLGSGLARIYPPEHLELAQTIAGQGALVSEYPMTREPDTYTFPRRNRIISGLSLGVVVVEAAQRSGALITADFALEQGREVFAVPGPMASVTSQGTHHLLKQGARLVTSVDDILEELHLRPETPTVTRRAAIGHDEGLSDLEQQVAGCVSTDEPIHVDTIVVRSGLASAEVSAALLQLELKRVVRQLPGKQFVRAGAHQVR